MVKSALRWKFSVDRGPDCLFVKLRVPEVTPQESNQLAENLWKILSRHSSIDWYSRWTKSIGCRAL